MMCVGGKNKSADRSANNLRVMRCMNLNNKLLTSVLKVFVNGLF